MLEWDIQEKDPMAYFQETIPVGGQFQEKEFKRYFEYRPTQNPWALANGLNYEIAVGPDRIPQVRFAKILKTVAYVAVDEDAEGKPVLQKWDIKKQWERV
jgi:hypothetical protein